MTKSKQCTALSLAALTLLMAGCAQQGDFPSLAKRPFETSRTAGETVAVPASRAPERASDAGLPARLSAAITRAQNGADAFASAFAIAQQSVTAAAGSAPGSELWIAAQLAITRLEPLRSPAQSAMISIDDESRAIITGVSDGDRAQIDAARAQVAAISDAQTAQIQNLIARLRTR
ncbi:MAG: hypothetical protein ACKVOJ_00520 [Sphingomonadaceae bacterium]